MMSLYRMLIRILTYVYLQSVRVLCFFFLAMNLLGHPSLVNTYCRRDDRGGPSLRHYDSSCEDREPQVVAYINAVYVRTWIHKEASCPFKLAPSDCWSRISLTHLIGSIGCRRCFTVYVLVTYFNDHLCTVAGSLFLLLSANTPVPGKYAIYSRNVRRWWFKFHFFSTSRVCVI